MKPDQPHPPVGETAYKRCRSCFIVKSLDEFYAAVRMRDLLQTDCKTCSSAYHKKRYAAGLVAKRKTNVTKKDRRKYGLAAKYNMSLWEYDELFKLQNGRCAICGTPPLHNRLSVDHDHDSGKVRGLLCAHCNTGIGYLRDDQEILNAAIMYLRRTQSET